jgi:nitrite reductase (NO-forming)
MTASSTEHRPLPGSRWRQGDVPASPERSERGSRPRVRLAQRQARRALGMAAVFVVAALVAGAVPQSSGRWLPLHLFLAGGIVLAISGSTVLFTVTWSAAPAPPARLLSFQRACVALGATGIAAARLSGASGAAFALAATLFVTGLVLLAFVLVRTVAAGVERRFDIAVTWYVAALAAGVVAAALGAAVGTGRGGGDLRDAHVALNLLGLVGLVIGGTLPSFSATASRSRMSPRATAGRHAATLVWQLVALTLTAAGLATGEPRAAAAGMAAYAFGLVALATLLPLPDRRKLQWAGPRLLGLWFGLGWWAAAVAAFAAGSLRGEPALTGNVLPVVVIAGYGQILWASYAYLVPMLRGGGHERLGQGFATTRSWPGLVALNAAGVALVAGAPPVAAVAVGACAVDAAVRAARLRLVAA